MAVSAYGLAVAAGLLWLFGTGASRAEEGAKRLISRPLSFAGFSEIGLGEDEVHHYPVDLEAGEYLYVEVDQRGTDLALAFLAPDGSMIFETDSPGGTLITERFGFVAEEANRYVVVVRPTSSLRTKKYGVRAEKRPAEPRDRDYAAACRQFLEAEVARREGDKDSLNRALFLYRKNRKAWRQLGHPLEEAVTLYRTALIWQSLGKREEVIKDFERALERIEQGIGDTGESTDLLALKTVTLLHSGPSFRKAIQPQRARQGYEEALVLARRIGDSASEATALNNLGVLSRFQSDFEAALEYFSRADDAYREIDFRLGLFSSRRNLGHTYMHLGRFADAEDALNEALEFSYDVDDPNLTAMAWNSLGLIQDRMDRPEAALECYRQGGQAAREAASSERVAAGLDNQGRTLMKLGRFEEAAESLVAAMALFEELDLPIRQNATRANLGWLYQARGDWRGSLELFQGALLILRQAQDRDAVFHTLWAIARAERELGRLESAMNHLTEALDILESMRSSTFSPAFRLSFLEPRHRFNELHIDILMELGEERAALVAADRARARTLLELLSEARAKIRKGFSQELLDRERMLWNAILELEKSPLSSNVKRTERQRRELIKRYDALQSQMRSSNLAYSTLTRPQALDLRRFQRKVLDEDTALLVFSLGERRSFLWHVTRDGFGSHELAARDTIETESRKLYKFLKTSYRTEIAGPARVQAALLSGLLLGDVYEDIRGSKRLAIVADGALEYIPFAVLPVPSNRALLIERHEIAMQPSLSALEALRRKTVTSPRLWSVAVVADPVYNVDDERLTPNPATPRDDDSGGLRYERLRFSREEAQAILSLIPEDRGFLALDYEASRETVLSGWLHGRQIVHFATHGILDAEQPALSRLVLSQVDADGQPKDNGFLWLRDIYDLDLSSSELVVLSACSTALGKEIRSEGLVGLTRGFMYAGAPRVVVSLWDVQDRATAELMKKFYRAILVDGEAPAAALRTAQVSMLQETRFQSPFFWAAFVLQGDWR